MKKKRKKDLRSLLPKITWNAKLSLFSSSFFLGGVGVKGMTEMNPFGKIEKEGVKSVQLY